MKKPNPFRVKLPEPRRGGRTVVEPQPAKKAEKKAAKPKPARSGARQ